MKPFLKWVGGKSQIIEEILSYFPVSFKNYHEIFIGGGSVLFSFLQKLENKEISISGNIYVYDINPYLIGLYKNIQTNSKNLYNVIKIIIDEFNSIDDTQEVLIKNPKNKEEAFSSRESYYYWIRHNYNNLCKTKNSDDINISSMFIFLNKTCFRGIYRESKNGFNVPYGHYKNPEIINKKIIDNVSSLLSSKNVIFQCMDFKDSIKLIEKDDFVYLDPPYVPINITSFVGYTKDSFTEHEKLFELCKSHIDKNAKFLMSNSDTELVKNNMSMYNISIIQCRRAINSKNPASKTNEVLIYN